MTRAVVLLIIRKQMKKRTDKKRPKKLWFQKSKIKTMLFFYFHRFVHKEFMHLGSTVNAELVLQQHYGSPL